jgi:signal peptidase II
MAFLMTARWPRPLFYLTFVSAIALDQATKAWAMTSLQSIGSMQLIRGCFNLTYTTNTGIAFGKFAGQGLLIGLFMVVLGLVAFSMSRAVNWTTWEPNVVGGGLCGGAVGNLLDRLRHGYVVDFFDAYLGPHHWPVFNVADSFICVAVAWIVLRQLFSSPKR